MENRVGVRVHLRVNGEVQPALQVSEVDTRYEGSLNPFSPGRVISSFTVENIGNVRLGAAGTVEGSGPFGLLASRSDVAQIREILPGQSMRLEEVTTSAWPLFRVQTQVSATPVVVGSDEVAGEMAAATAGSAITAIPWTQLLVLLALLALVLLWRRRRRGLKARRQAELDAARAEGARAAKEAASAGV